MGAYQDAMGQLNGSEDSLPISFVLPALVCFLR